MYLFPAEAELVHGAGVEVFDENIGLLDEFGQNGLPVGGGGVESERFFVGVELKKVVAGLVGVELEFVTGGVARAGAFYLYHFGAKPGEKLCTRRARLHIGEVDHFDSLERCGVHVKAYFMLVVGFRLIGRRRGLSGAINY